MRTRTNPYRFHKLRPGQLEYVAQINANFDVFERWQTMRMGQEWGSSTSSYIGGIVCYSSSGEFRLAIDNGIDSGYRDRPLGFLLNAPATGEDGETQNLGIFSATLRSGQSWPSTGSLAWLADEQGKVSISPGTTGVIVGIFLDSPYVLYNPALQL